MKMLDERGIGVGEGSDGLESDAGLMTTRSSPICGSRFVFGIGEMNGILNCAPPLKAFQHVGQPETVHSHPSNALISGETRAIKFT